MAATAGSSRPVLHQPWIRCRGHRLSREYRIRTRIAASTAPSLGRIDATDCADAGLHLAAAGLADRDRTAIWGASAGGFTVLSALSSTEVFQAGIARSAIIDPNVWGQSAPKFQAHHAAPLAGHLDDFASTRPLLLIHGDADAVTPLNQVRALSDRNPDITRLMVIPGAGHSFRRARDIARILAAELDSLFPLPQPAFRSRPLSSLPSEAAEDEH
ncbi:prolyl oligopeptidase family serine peptidase [Nonomuraea sp. NPDC050680]|uniref:prolyl oligopeptidase family serine peptidase n=1 Tax=Nonomuraea sp. NPDC050680 TaxID=3154630 RepID=UPI0033C9E51F